MIYLGGLTVGGTVPGVNGALLSALGDVQARATALASFAPSITPPSIAADIAVNASILANLTASVGIAPPSISLQVEIMAAALLLVEAQLQVIVDLTNLLGVAGAHAYHYAGTAAAMGGDVSADLGSGLPGGAGGDAINALVIATQLPACWTAIQGVFKTTP